MPDFARRLRGFIAVLLDPVRSGVICRQQFGVMALLAVDGDAGGLPALELLGFDIVSAFDLTFYGQAGFNGTVLLFVDGTVIDAKRRPCRTRAMIVYHRK